MDPANHPGLVTSPEMTMPGNLDILAQTAASQSADIGLQDGASYPGISVLRLSENTAVTLPLLNQSIRIEGQPGGPMLSQTQIQKLLGVAEPDKGPSPGPLSIIPTTGFSDPGQPSPASLSQNSHILQYRQSVTSGDAMLSAINYSDNEILHENFDNLGNLDDGLLSSMGNASRLSENPTSETFNLFEGDGDSLTMETLSPELIISDSGGLSAVNTVTDSNDSNIPDSSSQDDKKKQIKAKSKPLKGQISPGKGGTLECNQCHKVFNNTSALAKHKLTHSDERKYVCNICEKKFKRQDHLNGHLMTHRDKKPYQCMVTGCDKSYCDARSLRRHLENHHQHTPEQIATEMVAAQSTAAEVLAEVSLVPGGKGTGLGSTNTNNVVKSSSNSVEKYPDSTPVRVVISDTNDNKLINIQPVMQAGARTTVSVPVNVQMTNKDLTASSQPATLIPLESIKQQIQLAQEHVKPEPNTAEQNNLEVFKRLQQQLQLEQQAIVSAHVKSESANLHSLSGSNSGKSSSNSSWQDYKSPPSNIQSPHSGATSPGYSEMSPVDTSIQPATSPVRSMAQTWANQTSQSLQMSAAPPANVTVADAKSLEEMSKPVACNICERRFKNIPALNGHMRLHGGYFKKDAALKEEKKKKGEMAPPPSIPAKSQANQPQLPSRSQPSQSQPVGIVRKSKGNPPIQSPPSEELHALHWQQKQQEQQEQQLQQQIHQELQWQLKRQEQERQLKQQQQDQEEKQQQLQQWQLKRQEQERQLKQQQHDQEEKQQQLQQWQLKRQEQERQLKQQQQDQEEKQQHIQHELQQQIKQQQQQKEQEQQQQQIQQKIQQLKQQEEQQKLLLQHKLLEQQQLQFQQLQQQHSQELLKQQAQENKEISAVEYQLAQAGVDAQQIEQIKLQLQQQQQQQQQQLQEKQFQMLYEQQQQGTESGVTYSQMEMSPQVPQSPHLPTSPGYLPSPHVPQSPHSVAQSPLIQRQGSVEHLQSPGVEYNRQTFPQELSDFGGYRDGAIDQNLLNDLQHQLQLQSQNVDLNSIQEMNVDLQSVSVNSVPSGGQGPFQAAVINNSNQGNQLTEMQFNPSVNIHHNNSAFQTQISGPFITNGQLSGVEPSHISSSASSHQTSEIVSQIITSLEDLGEVPPGSMQQIPKQSDHVLQSAHTAGSSANFQQDSQINENGMLSMKNNSYPEFAHNSVVHNPVPHIGHVQFSPLHSPPPSSLSLSSSSSGIHSSSLSSSMQQGSDSRTCVKQELLKHLASKPTSPRAASSLQFSFQFNQNIHLKNKITNSVHNRTPLSPNEHRNSEIKRRLSAGLEDYRPMVHNPGTRHGDESRDLLTNMSFKPPLIGRDSKPRMRSKSGDDYNLRQWRNDDQSFMRPRDKTDADFMHRPRSKTDEHLTKWNNKEVLSRSDGAGMFRNPSSIVPGSFKIRRKQRPAPLIIPSHANHCGFQSRLRSPRIGAEGQDGINSAPVPYTPPPMLSPSRRGAGLYYSVNMVPQFGGPVNATPSTPRPSLLRSASIPVSKEESPLLSSSTIPAEEELQPPESDIQPHVNVGPQYQAVLPLFNPKKSTALHDPSKEDLIWEPGILKDVADEDVQSYQDLARSAAVKGNGCNVEHALHILYLAKGDLQKALLMLMSGSCVVPCKHSLMSYHYQESEVWSSEEIESYTQALMTHDKDFFNVAKEVKTKSVRSCVQFYYLWKKVLVDEHKRLRVMRRRREQLYNLRSSRQQQGTDQGSEQEVKEGAVVEEEEDARDDDDDMSTSSSTSALTEDQHVNSMDDKEDFECDDITRMMPSPVRIPSPTPTLFTCDYPECNSSFTSKPALNAHLKIHSKVKKPDSSMPNPPYEINKPKPLPSQNRSPIRSDGQEETFPCKLCGRVFMKVKSRSAHMKIHRPDQDKEREKKAKAEKQAKAVLEKSRLEAVTFASLNGPHPSLTHQTFPD